MTTQIHECHPHDTKEQLYDVRLGDVQLHDENWSHPCGQGITFV